MEKVVNLKNDPIFRNSIPYDDEVGYNLNGKETESERLHERSEQIKEAIHELVMSGELDATDLKIIQARDCSPMPSVREVASILKIPRATVQDKIGHIKSLVIKAL